MSGPRCCGTTARASLLGRGVGVVRWAAPGAILAVMPKCPVCLAGYIALWTGIGLSAAAAARFRIAVIVLCIAFLVCLAAGPARRLLAFFARRTAPRSSSHDHRA